MASTSTVKKGLKRFHRGYKPFNQLRNSKIGENVDRLCEELENTEAILNSCTGAQVRINLFIPNEKHFDFIILLPFKSAD